MGPGRFGEVAALLGPRRGLPKACGLVMLGPSRFENLCRWPRTDSIPFGRSVKKLPLAPALRTRSERPGISRAEFYTTFEVVRQGLG